MVDRQAQAEAWYRKPKRIIHNQALIVALYIGISLGSPVLVMCVFWLVFVPYPTIVIPSLVLVWCVSSVAYVVYYWKK